MLPKQEQFLGAVNDKKKVSVRFYSQADHGVLERICAPMSYGRGSERQDELNRYRLWDYASIKEHHSLGLGSRQIVDFQVFGTEFNPAAFATPPSPISVPPNGGLAFASAASSGDAAGLRL